MGAADRTVRTVLFDLDGTLSDSAAGILAALRYGLAASGLPPFDARTERALLGPPFYESLPPLIGADAVPGVIAAYREHYAQSMFDSTVYPGVADLLDALRAVGAMLAVATSKPEHFAAPLVEHLGLADRFAVIGGDDLAGTRRTKALVIGSVLQRLGDPDPGSVMMVGDRSMDVLGAREHGIDAVAVTWGYSVPGELAAVAPAATCSTAAEVGAVLGVSVGA